MGEVAECSLGTVHEAVEQGASSDAVAEALSRALVPLVAHDALRVAATNPAAEFGPAAFSFWHKFDPGLGLALLHRAYACGNQSAPQVPGDDLYRAYGVGSELLVPIRDRRGAWGTLELLRSHGGRQFDAEDARRAVRLGPALARVLRQYVTAGPLAPRAPMLAPGVIIVGPDHRMRAATPEAYAWREHLRTSRRTPDFTDAAHLAGLSLQTRRRLNDPHARRPVLAAPAASHGRWVGCHAQPLDDDSGDVAVVIEALTGKRLLPSFCDWYSLTPRERQIVHQLCEGAAAKHIARSLGLSVHTVNEHLKAVFRKTAAGGRDELVAAITS
ncbi:LuxR C-terminal-related transcriptional regulator [Amycolatopsis sp. FU40]|uniref:LuxR C-terminal-related transcriptional regulator n=1 Tax=Amycolatopsis sp. FU40 TaxID=2914159 RepID=UPI001F0300D4|nr:LuxR C-terminal-related transcriptional regulator [Amycolatopsis sp. FU40]UKD57495.1 LuxR C-terminal-related transcriptional regulator [Amycolatopsis sp. FU40]